MTEGEDRDDDGEAARFFAVSPIATAVVGHDGRTRSMNAAWTALLEGARRGEVLVDRVADADRPALEDAIERVRGGAATSLHVRLVQQDRREREVDCELVGESGRDHFYCLLRPGPGLELPSLYASMLKPLAESDGIGLLLVSAADHKPIYANDAAGRIWEIPDFAARVQAGVVTADELRARLADLVVSKDDLQAMRAELAKENGRREFELVLRGDRCVRWLVLPANDANGQAFGRLYISRDVSDRKATEGRLAFALARLERSEREFRTLLELIPEGISVLKDGIVTYVNPAAARIYGSDRVDEMVGVHISALVPPEELSSSFERLRQMTEKNDSPSMVRRFMRKDGSVGHIETRGFPVEIDGARATLTILHDVTDKHRIEAKMRQAERLASLGMLSAAIAHEINNPLAYILLNLQATRRWLDQLLAAEPSKVLTDTRELIEQSLEGVERVRTIVRDLRAFSHADDSDVAVLDVRTVIESVIPMADHEIRPRAKLYRKYDDVPMVLANAPRLGQVFLNLLVNAAQAIPEGQPNQEIHIATFADEAGHAVITVRDTGEGMTHDVRERLFEPFFTTKQAGLGTGLGLSLCLRIVQALGGDISVESTLGQGSVFRVTLPPASAVAENEPSPLAPSTSVARAKVLIIDDEPRICRRLAELLTDHEVEIASTGKDGIARLAETAFDVVFCDLMMPDVRGTDVFEIATRARPELRERFVFMTAGAFTPAARALLDRVSNLRLDKPFTEEQVAHVLAIVLGQRVVET